LIFAFPGFSLRSVWAEAQPYLQGAMRGSAPYRATISRPARAGLRHGEDKFWENFQIFAGAKAQVSKILTARLKPVP
jgi:hypothetical protein